MDIEHLSFSSAPQKVAPFSHAVRAGEYLFITGQMPTLKNDSTKLVRPILKKISFLHVLALV